MRIMSRRYKNLTIFGNYYITKTCILILCLVNCYTSFKACLNYFTCLTVLKLVYCPQLLQIAGYMSKNITFSVLCM